MQLLLFLGNISNRFITITSAVSPTGSMGDEARCSQKQSWRCLGKWLVTMCKPASTDGSEILFFHALVAEVPAALVGLALSSRRWHTHAGESSCGNRVPMGPTTTCITQVLVLPEFRWAPRCSCAAASTRSLRKMLYTSRNSKRNFFACGEKYARCNLSHFSCFQLGICISLIKTIYQKGFWPALYIKQHGWTNTTWWGILL